MKLAEILDNLKQPIPNHFIRRDKKIKGKECPYIQIWQYYELLDERCNPENWEIKLEITQTGSLTVAIASLTIIGEDRSITRMAVGNESDDLDSYGDPTSNASSQAIRRVCAMFGLSRDLWLKKGKNEPSLPNIPQNSQSRGKGQITREEWLKRKAQVN